MVLFRIDAPHFCAGGDIQNGQIVWAAPIISYMVGWDVKKAHDYCKRKKWNITSYKIEKVR